MSCILRVVETTVSGNKLARRLSRKEGKTFSPCAFRCVLRTHAHNTMLQSYYILHSSSKIVTLSAPEWI